MAASLAPQIIGAIAQVLQKRASSAALNQLYRFVSKMAKERVEQELWARFVREPHKIRPRQVAAHWLADKLVQNPLLNKKVQVLWQTYKSQAPRGGALPGKREPKGRSTLGGVALKGEGNLTQKETGSIKPARSTKAPKKTGPSKSGAARKKGGTPSAASKGSSASRGVASSSSRRLAAASKHTRTAVAKKGGAASSSGGRSTSSKGSTSASRSGAAAKRGASSVRAGTASKSSAASKIARGGAGTRTAAGNSQTNQGDNPGSSTGRGSMGRTGRGNAAANTRTLGRGAIADEVFERGRFPDIPVMDTAMDGDKTLIGGATSRGHLKASDGLLEPNTITYKGGLESSRARKKDEQQVACRFKATMEQEVVLEQAASLEVIIARKALPKTPEGMYSSGGSAAVLPSKKLIIRVRALAQCIIEGKSEEVLQVPAEGGEARAFFTVRPKYTGTMEVLVEILQAQILVSSLILKPKCVKKRGHVLGNAVTEQQASIQKPYPKAIVKLSIREVTM